MCLQNNYNEAHIVAVFTGTKIKSQRHSCGLYFSLSALSGTLHLSITFMLKDILMYQDLIRNELNEAAETLANF